MTVDEWITAYAAALGIARPSDEDVEHLLDLAGIAAHASDRTAAPVSCWLAARAGVEPSVALALARDVAGDA
ncbi:MAG TPA: DUF6457 domain-containing protein [Acidimicrobiia bacterium]|jgi:hypothetical protein